MPSKTKGIRIAVAACLTMAAAATAGDLNSEVNNMFNNLGAVGNYTAPGAFRGQAFNTYSGGSFMMRSQNKTYQLASIQYPTVTAGCGGIDAFGGSFSHISATEFKNMLQKITSALPGIAFQLAIEVVSPLLGGETKWAKNLETILNNAKINSCNTAKSLVSSAAEATGFSSSAACEDLAVKMGLEPDYAAAAVRCHTDKPSILSTAQNSPNPELKNKAPFIGNLTWKSLQMAGSSLDDQEREIIMSMVGTVIYYAQDRDPNPIPPTLTSITQLLYGESDAGGGAVLQPMLKCNNYTDCDVVIINTGYKHTPFTTKVENMMRSISDKILTRTPILNNSPEVGFVNQTSEPVFRMLSVGAGVPAVDATSDLIGKYRDLIAADYAYVFLERNVRLGLNAMDKDYLLTPDQRSDSKEIRQRARDMLAQLGREKTQLYQKVGSINTVASQIEQLERQMRSTMPQHVMDMLGRKAAYLQ